MTTSASAPSFMVGTQLNTFLGKKVELKSGWTHGQPTRSFQFVFQEQIMLGEIIQAVPGAGDVDLGQMVVSNPMLEVEKNATSRTFRFTGDITLGAIEAQIELEFAKGNVAGRGGKSKGGYTYLMRILFRNPFDLGRTLGVSGMEGVLFTNHSLYGLLGFIVTNDQSAGQRYQNLMPGFNFYGGFAITDQNEVFAFIGKLLGIQTIDLYMGASDDAFQMEAALGLHQRLTDSISLSEIALVISTIYKPPQTEVRIKTVLMVQAHQEVLRLSGSVGFEQGPAGLGVFGSFTMLGKWHDPFGFSGLTIADVAAQVGCMPEFPWLKELGLTGKIEIGSAALQLTMFVDIKNPQKAGFIARGENMRIGQMINTLTGPDVTIPGSIIGVMDAIELRQLELQVVPQPFAIGELRFDETGITVLADVQLWSWKAYMKVRADYDEGITAYANMEGFSIAGGLLSVDKSTHGVPKEIPGFPLYTGPQLYIRISPTSMPEVYISASVSIFGITADALIDLSGGDLHVKLELDLFHLFTASVELKAKTDLSLLYVKAHLQNDFLRKLTALVKDFIHQSVQAAQQKLDQAIGKIQEARAALDRIAAKWYAAVRALQDAVAMAQREVDKLEGTISSLERDIRGLDREIDHLKWYEKVKAIPLGIEMAATYVALGAVKIARGAANLVLAAARLALEAFEKVNPLEIILLPFKGALLATEGVLKGTKAAVGGIAHLAEAALEFAGEFFDVREAMFEGQYSRAPENDSFVTIKASLVFMGKPIDSEFGLDLKALESGAKGLMQKLLGPIGDLGFVPDVVHIPVLGSLLS